jgi:ABC-type glycerol-3-phosphate transport system substrate-binding protein
MGVNIMRKTKILSIFVILFIISAVSMFIACSKNVSSEPQSENNTASADIADIADITEEKETAGETRLEPDLPEKDFEGFEIKLLGRTITEGSERGFGEVYSEEENGELLNDAVYKRNLTVEKKYNIKITGVISPDIASLEKDIRKNVSAGNQAFDAAFASISDSAKLAQNGLIVDLKTVPNIDFTKPWWDRRAVNDLSIGNKLYFAVGDITPWAYPYVNVLIVNKDLIKEYGLENPYELVRSNNWTFDKFREISAGINNDINGDGIMDEYDRYGILLAREQYPMMFIAGSENFAKKDSDDLPYLTLNNDRAADVANKLFDMFKDKNTTMIMEDFSSGYSDPWNDVLRAQFRRGNGAFYPTWLAILIIFRDLDTEVGLLPLPKYDSNQNGYYHIISDWWASSIAVPTTNTTLEETGFILEALCAESKYTVRPAFYDYTLTKKMMRDEDSEEMLDIILESRSYDVGYIYNWNGIRGIFENMLANNTFSFSSEIEKKQNGIEKAMQKMIENFMENN